jgi:hypothetical protein
MHCIALRCVRGEFISIWIWGLGISGLGTGDWAEEHRSALVIGV